MVVATNHSNGTVPWYHSLTDLRFDQRGYEVEAMATNVIGPSNVATSSPGPITLYTGTHNKRVYTFMHGYIHTYVHTFIHTYVHTFIHTYIYLHNAHIHGYIHICTHECIHTYKHLYVNISNHIIKVDKIESL